MPRNNTGTSPIGDVEVQNPGWANMQTVTTENVNAQFMNINEIGYDQNHNQLPVSVVLTANHYCYLALVTLRLITVFVNNFLSSPVFINFFLGYPYI